MEQWFNCYGPRGELFLPETNRHPAKMAVNLCFRILERMRERGWIRPGDWILDPMCGVGTTLICGLAMGHNVMGVELEQHFVKMCWENFLHAAEKLGPARIGRFTLACGDARKLPEILASQCSAVCTSPPYCDQAMPSNVRASLRQLWKAGKHEKAIAGYQKQQQEQIAKGQKFACDSEEVIRARFQEAVERETANYRVLPDVGPGPAAAITSPPYAGVPGTHDNEESRLGLEKGQIRQYGQSDARQIGNLPDVEITNQKSEIRNAGLDIRHPAPETYCSAMLQVYRGMHAVLKPGGVVALVTKNRVKRGKIRRLDEDTIRLMEAAGFVLLDRVRAMLAEDLGAQLSLEGADKPIRRERKSFFKRLFENKNPKLKVDWEDVMFFQKQEPGVRSQESVESSR